MILFQQPCGDNDDIICTVSDSGNPYTCGSEPGISGIVLPDEPLSNFNNLPANGTWTLRVFDAYNGDGGFINAVSLNFCNVVSANLNLGVADDMIAKVSVYPNPANSVINVSLPENTGGTVLQLFDIQGRSILIKTTNNSNETLAVENLQEGLYLLAIDNGQYKTTKKVIIRR
ncbi:T9SS type A sorting domain-containing protein [Flavobacterium sp. 3HN19-14]|uniref:T9SS type A sorting domain-containing protein n=1 Tax=Flavobacterium sp. 3HN19-14 TaxID=3448133 RepID=UPI003EE09FB3